ncbi:sensor histidine kinase ComP [Kordia sp. SMS9]|uniref:ATP-binding protein n=1 Tax=Kordia sp. SMS9 TaxID=2282170 RepID=UPI000E0DB448|nr:tetratricopeptide repeat-containing sensor histidine kinase [Kordia sp. SMS9]AXG70028.1 sensor histidine kinase ComP [Kordia sp. SMS9]
MKNKINSFLFFIIVSFLFGSEYLFSQSTNDSIAYYIAKVQDFNTVDDLIKARNYLEQKEIELKRTDLNRLYLIYHLSSADKAIGDFIKAENLLVEILDNIQQFKSSDYRDYYHKAYYLLLANIYRDQKNGEKAIELYNRAFEKAKIAHDSAVIYNNISNVFKDVSNYKKSEEVLKKAYPLIPRMIKQNDIAKIYDNLGFAMSMLGNKTGEEYMNKGLEIRLKINDYTGLHSSYTQLAIYYKKFKKDSLAKLYASKALNTSKNIGIPKYRKKALGLFLDFSDDVYIKEYKRLNDSLSDAEASMQNKYAMYRYDKAKSEAKALKAEKKVLESEFRMLMFAFLGGLIFIVAVFWIVTQRNRNKRHTLAEIYKTERNFSKKVHDELGNDIFYLMNQLQINPASLLEKEGLQILNGLNEIYVKARDISKKYTTIETGERYHDELLSLLNSFGSDTTKIVTNEIALDFWQSVSTLKKEQLYRVLQELLTNMKKHSKATLVGITFTKIKKQVIIKYVDNGKGATKKELLVKNGLENVENRIGEINGTITFETNPSHGFKAEIRFIQ